MEKALEKSWNNYYITTEGKVLLLKDIDLEILHSKYVKKYKVYKVLFKKISRYWDESLSSLNMK